MTYQKYDFTAFTASDLLAPGDSHMSYGDTFVMPALATTSISVSDNDAHLSGDGTGWYSNDHAADSYGQHASIHGPDGATGNGGQIYAESYFRVKDQWGNEYFLIEIEQEGSHQDYFTFYGSAGTPPAGAHLTVVSGACDLSGVNYSHLGAGEKAEPTGSIKGTVFFDSDHDNTQMKGHDLEAGIGHVTVELLDAHGNVVDTVTTDAHGNYTFDGVVAGDYSVRFDEPEGLDFVHKDVGSTSKDSDADRSTGETVTFHVGAGQDICNIDAGLKTAPSAVIKGRLFVDTNHDNSELDANHQFEAGFDGATVKLLDAHGNVVETTTTDAHGNYKFEGLSKGNYTVQFEEPEGHGFVKADAADYRIDSDADVHTGKTVEICLTDDTTVCDVDAGIKQQTGSINGTVFCDTDCDGKSAETTVVPGETITVEAEHMERCYFDVKSGSEASGGKFVQLQTTKYWDDGYLQTHFSGEKGTYDLKLHVQDENDGVSTIYVYVNGHKVKAVKLDTGADGGGGAHSTFSTFVIEDLQLSKGDQIKLIADGDCYEYVRIDKLTFQGADKVVTTAEPVKANVTVNLLNAAGTIVDTTTTDDHGNYSFGNVPVGDYTIQGIAPDGTEFTIQDVANNTHDDIDSDVGADGKSDTITVVANSSTDIDLGVCEIKTGAIEGRYFFDANRNDVDDDEAGVSGITVELLDGDNNVVNTASTGADGSYSFGDVEAGTYTVRFVDPNTGTVLAASNVGSDDTIDSDAIDQGNGVSIVAGVTVVAGETVSDVDAGVQDALGSIEGRYFFDANRNDVDDNEAGVSGITVDLLDAAGTVIATATTGADGSYTLADVPAGDYTVRFVDPNTGTVLAAPNVGGDDTIDSDAIDQGNGVSIVSGVTVVAGETVSDIDAGVQAEAGALSGTYFLDRNDDDLDNAGDGDVSGKTVQLFEADGVTPATDIDGNPVASVSTDAQGNYRFVNLAAGSYVVGFALPTAAEGTEFVAPNAGDDAIDSDVINTVLGTTAPVAVVAGEETTDVDAGVVDINEAPVAADDAGMVCVGETTTINLLEGDTDPEGDALTVLTISDDDETAIAGETITLASGATATLNADGTVSVDATSAAPDLLINDTLADEFIYVVSDGDQTDTGNVDLTLKGALNTVDTIDVALGDVGIVTGELYFDNTVGGDLYTLDITTVEFPETQLGEVLSTVDDLDLTFCLSVNTLIPLAPESNDFTVSVLDAASYSAAIEGAVDVSAVLPDFGFNPDNIDNVNWLLNQIPTLLDEGVSEGTIQRAIWNLVDGGADSVLDSSASNRYFADRPVYGTFEEAFELTQRALANDGFEAGSGDLVGVIFDPVEDGVQPLVAAIEFDLLSADCIC